MLRLGREVCYRGEESVDVSSTAYALPTPELVLDRYRPLRPIGRGGSGSVWLARDERTGLEVALKIVPREGKRASRAAREMEAASRLRHERCVRAYAVGGDSGHVYIAYEYVQGQTMREALRAGKLNDREAIEAAAQILDALAHAHRLGIVHRDVKPSNVLVEQGPDLSIRLLDFGLAQFDEADTLTAVGDVPGTLAYIAPERLAGGDATTSSDIWAVGVLLWESLAGEHPFWGVPLPQVAAAIEAGARPLAEIRPDLPPAVADAVSSALTVSPAGRPSAERLAADLRAAAISPRRDRTSAARPRKAAAAPKALPAPLPLERRLVPAGLAAVTVIVGATLLPFWTPGLMILLAVAAALTTLRSPRLGLAIALFVPIFPLGNVAQAAAVVYAALAVGWLALCWRDARAGLLFMSGPVLAAIGAVALLPLAVQPARGRARRALQAAAGVFAAVAVAGLRGNPLPLTDVAVPSLGIDGSTSISTVIRPVVAILQANPGLVALAVVLAASAALLPDARQRGLRGIALLGLCQIGLIHLLAPTLSALSVALGTCVLCAVLAALSAKAGRYP
jgi:hypothetical protein